MISWPCQNVYFVCYIVIYRNQVRLHNYCWILARLKYYFVHGLASAIINLGDILFTAKKPFFLWNKDLKLHSLFLCNHKVTFWRDIALVANTSKISCTHFMVTFVQCQCRWYIICLYVLFVLFEIHIIMLKMTYIIFKTKELLSVWKWFC